MIHATRDYDISKIPEDEPVFLLRARDPFATKAISRWIDAAEGHVPADRLDLVEQHMLRFEKWQRYNHMKIPGTDTFGEGE